MTAAAVLTSAARVPGPPGILPGRPDAIVDLQSEDGLALVEGTWRYADARVEEAAFVELGSAEDPLGPGTVPNRTYDVVPHAQAADYDDRAWRVLAPEETTSRLGAGRVSFNWYRLAVTLPERIGELEVRGATVVFEIVVDDYAEVWVDGALPHALGTTGGPVVAGFNAPNRVVLTRDARPGETFAIAVFGINGPISTSPENYIWVRTATLDVYAAERAVPARPVPLEVERFDDRLGRLVPDDPRLERVAGGFEFTEGPLWSPDGALLFSSPNTNVLYRLDPALGTVDVLRAKSGYAGTDVGRYGQPGSNGLTWDADGRLVLCQHGNRQVLRVNPHGDTTVLAHAWDGRRLNSPNDVVVRRLDGSLWFTDPPFGLPGMAGDPDRELPFSGVFRIAPDGALSLVDDRLEGPNGIAFSPDESVLYVGDWDPHHKAVVRYELDAGGAVRARDTLVDLTGEPGEDAIDGLKVDEAGNVWICGPGGVWVVSAMGERLGLLRLPEAPHNLAWGGSEARDLYVTALTSVYRLRTTVRGITPHTPRSRP